MSDEKEVVESSAPVEEKENVEDIEVIDNEGGIIGTYKGTSI